MLTLCALALLWCALPALGDDGASGAGNDRAAFALIAQKAYETARVASRTNDDDETKWRLGRACFDWAEELKSNNSRREQVAQEGIAACRQLLGQNPTSAPGHYYLAMNLGEVADVRRFTALKKVVPQMEAEFKAALGLDPQLDSAGPDRNLGLLYLQAPGWPLSLGSKAKGKHHLLQALKLAPEYPENLLNVIEAELDWGEKKEAAKHLESLDEVWPKAQARFNTPEWSASWFDWAERRTAARKKAGQPVKAAGSPRMTEQN
jgi:tetratricopeptide (TPR) repeat protein